MLRAPVWRERETALAAVYTQLAEMHNDLKVTSPIPTVTGPFFSRDIQVIHGGVFAEALKSAVIDEAVRLLDEDRAIGGIDAWCDSADLLEDTSRYSTVCALIGTSE